MVDEKEPVLPLGSFLFPRIFQAFRMSIQPTKLILAFLALAAICLTGGIMDLSNTVVKARNVTFLVRPGESIKMERPGGQITELDVYVEHGIAMRDPMKSEEQAETGGVFATLWDFGAEQFHNALYALFALDIPEVFQSVGNCFKALAWAFRCHTAYSVIFFAVALAVMALTGGAICRIAALQFAQGEKPGLTEAVRFGVKKFTGFVTAPITPAAILVFIGAFIFLLGLCGNIPIVGELSVGLFLPLAFVAAAIVAVIAIGTVAGLSLMFPTIAYEDSDCFDAISRSFSYVYAKPWRMGFYTAIAVVYGAISYVFVRFFSFLLLWITYRFLQLGFLQKNAKLHAIWPEPHFADFLGSPTTVQEMWSTSTGAFLIYIWVLVVVGLMVSFVISFYFSASTIIYALMRNRVDRIALEEIYTYSDEMAAEPAAVQTPAEETPSDAEAKTEEKSETSE